MEIRINGKAADIKADSEKTVGEIMAGLEQWLANSGHRLSGFAIDGQTTELSSLEGDFSREIDTVKILDVFTSSMAELSVMSLLNLLGDIDEYENLDFEEKPKFYENWRGRPAAIFAAEQMPDIFSLCENTFLNGGLSSQVLRAITEERLREVETPAEEFSTLRSLVEETCSRLIDLPLDIQTGKDRRAAETIQAFSSLAEKIIRIFKQLNIQGYISDADNPVLQLIGEFNETVKEFSQACETQDTVLTGDLAEYEIAPRLQELYNTINKISLKLAAGIK